jgi:protein O-GlcNAc transferase
VNIGKTLDLVLEHFQSGEIKQAEHICKEILNEYPNNVDALHFLGVIYSELQNQDLAINLINRALQIDPNFADAHNNLGNIYQKVGQIDDAIVHYRKSLQLKPNVAQTYFNLGIALQDKKRINEAIDCYQKALELNLKKPGVYNNLGLALKDKGQVDEAIANYQEALCLNPTFADAYNNLGIALQEKGLFDEAIANYQEALCLNPTFADAYNNLGITFKEKGQIDEAEIWIRRAIQRDRNNSTYYSNLLLVMSYNGSHDAKSVYFEHLNFSKQYEETFSSSILPHTNNSDPSRKLKIGYVSPDFKKHPVAYFIEAVLLNRDKENFTVFCYSNALIEDEVTKRIKGYADQWRNIVAISDDEIAKLIRRDEIDILIDLAGHTANNRLLVFARKPAPIQINWIGYPPTTGLSTMDYKIVDNYTDPPGETEHFYTEKLMRLPESFVVYLPDKNCPEVGPLPALSAGYITFGSLNNFAKATPDAFSLWAQILNAVPHSRLMMQWKGFSDITIHEQTIKMFKKRGISKERIILQYWKQSPKHFESYNLIDIGLDTFPFNGLTTTCEALWMGVPVIALAGTAYASRAGVSLLSNIKLFDLIAKTSDEYVNIAINLSSDIKRLQILRESLRDMMKRSPLCDAKRFTTNLEMCYRKMWETWCQSV